MEALQGTLFSSGALSLRTDVPVQRTWLDARSWVDVAYGWLDGQLELYERLAASPIWHQGHRPMYGREVAEPRLSAGMRLRGAETPPVIRDMGAALGRRYGAEMSALWLNWYRSGDEAVAWHADRIGQVMSDPPVAIVSLGSTRRFLLRPKGGGRSRVFTPGGGDLLVMGGACQHDWEHSVPRSLRGGPRISVTFRPSGGSARGPRRRSSGAVGATRRAP